MTSDITTTAPPQRSAAPRLRPPRVLGGPTRDSVDIDELLEVYDSHHPGAETRRIEAAFALAELSHAGVTRRSGDPYISHPIEVAEITADLGMDEVSVCAALLHDVVEDSDVTLAEIRALFADGPWGDPRFAEEVARCVDGLTKLDGLHYDTEGGHRAAELRRFLLATAADPRVLVVKLADRLHNMRTLAALSETKRRRIATETLEVFAPLAHRLGISSLRNELEDLAFATLWPQRHAELARLVAERHAGVHDELAAMLASLSEALDAADISAEVSWRVKHLWGIHTKMERRGRSFEEIHDVVGVRVIVAEPVECYAALGLCHALWTPAPGSFRDMIASPLFNAYQSLHTTVRGPHGTAVEVQIRTREMHTTAEYGLAAHWTYKEDVGAAATEIAEVSWMRRLLEAAAEGDDVSAATAELARTEIFCFTPQGRIIELPAGSTPVDFAYQVHTEVGDRAVGALVDAKMVSLDYRLNGGEQVEIICSTDPERGPNRNWLRFVATSKARSLIRRWHTRARRSEMAAAGFAEIAAAVERRCARGGVPRPADADLEALISDAAPRFGVDTGEVLAAQVGDRHISAEAVAARIIVDPTRPAKVFTPLDGGGRREVLVAGVGGIDVSFAGCCEPHPFDPIVGWVTTGRGVSVHRTDCTNIGPLVDREPGRAVGVNWIDTVDRDDVSAEIRIESIDRTGLFADCSTVLGAHGADIRAVSGETSSTFGVQRYRIRVGDPGTLDAIETALWGLDGVCDVTVTPTPSPQH